MLKNTLSSILKSLFAFILTVVMILMTTSTSANSTYSGHKKSEKKETKLVKTEKIVRTKDGKQLPVFGTVDQKGTKVEIVNIEMSSMGPKQTAKNYKLIKYLFPNFRNILPDGSVSDIMKPGDEYKMLPGSCIEAKFFEVEPGSETEKAMIAESKLLYVTFNGQKLVKDSTISKKTNKTQKEKTSKVTTAKPYKIPKNILQALAKNKDEKVELKTTLTSEELNKLVAPAKIRLSVDYAGENIVKIFDGLSKKPLMTITEFKKYFEIPNLSNEKYYFKAVVIDKADGKELKNSNTIFFEVKSPETPTVKLWTNPEDLKNLRAGDKITVNWETTGAIGLLLNGSKVDLKGKKEITLEQNMELIFLADAGYKVTKKEKLKISPLPKLGYFEETVTVGYTSFQYNGTRGDLFLAISGFIISIILIVVGCRHLAIKNQEKTNQLLANHNKAMEMAKQAIEKNKQVAEMVKNTTRQTVLQSVTLTDTVPIGKETTEIKIPPVTDIAANAVDDMNTGKLKTT